MKKVRVKGYKRKSPKKDALPSGRERERGDYAKGVRRSVAESGRRKETRDTNRVLTAGEHTRTGKRGRVEKDSAVKGFDTWDVLELDFNGSRTIARHA